MRKFGWIAVGAASGGAVVGTVARLVWIREANLNIDWPSTFSAISDIGQTVALIVGGIWTYRLFVKQRTDRIRADVTLVGAVVARDHENILIRATLEIKNVGNVELCPHKAYVRVQDISRKNASLRVPASSTGAPHHPHTSVEEWPEVATCALELNRDDQLTLEPGESERYPMDFLVSADFSVVQLRAIVRADANEEEGVYWDETTILDLSSLVQLASIPSPANTR